MDKNHFRSFALVLVLILGLTACKWEQKYALSQNEDKWKRQDITNYRYKVDTIGLWGTYHLSVQIENGKLVLIQDEYGNIVTEDWKGVATIEAIFAEIEAALSMENRKVRRVVYDDVYGFPTEIVISYNQRSVGAEYDRRYFVSNFEVLHNPIYTRFLTCRDRTIHFTLSIHKHHRLTKTLW